MRLGIDFDGFIFRELVENCSEGLRQKLLPKERSRERAFVLPMCRDLKESLSEDIEREITLHLTMEETETFSLTRARFNELIHDLVSKTITCCDRLISDTKLEWNQIDRVLLVGGSCRIPYIREVIARKWGKTPFQIDDPELAVCLGAAIYGAELDSESPESYLQKGLAKFQTGEYRGAIAEYQTAIKLDSSHVISHRALGIAWYSQGKYAEAISEYQIALQIDPNHANTHCNLAMALQVRGNYAEAISEYQIALQINPNHTDARSNLKILETQLQKKQQKNNSDRANSNTNCDTEQVIKQGLTNLQQEKYSAAIDIFDRIIKSQSNNKLAYLYRGLTNFYLGNYQKTVEDCETAIQLDNQYTYAHLGLGFALFCLGNTQTAIQAFNNVLKIDKNQPEAYLGRSLSYVCLNQHQRAIADLNQLKNIADDFDTNEYNRVLTEFVQGNKKEVVKYLKQVTHNFIIATSFNSDDYQKYSTINSQRKLSNNQTYTTYLSQIIPQFQEQNFQCQRNISYHRYTFGCVAEGRKTLALIQPLKTFFVFAEFDSVDITELRKFNRESFNHCSERRKQELIKLTGFLCYPIAVVNNVNSATIEALRREPPNCETSLFTSYSFAFPIILDLTSMQLYFSEQRPFFGWALWPSIRKIAQEMLI